MICNHNFQHNTAQCCENAGMLHCTKNRFESSCCVTSPLCIQYLGCDYCNWVHLDKVDQSDSWKKQYILKKLVVDQSAAHKKNNKLLEAQNLNMDSKHFSRKQFFLQDNLFLLETLHTMPRGHMFDTSCYFAICQQFLHHHCCTLQWICDLKLKIWLTFTFFTSVNTLTDLGGNIGFLQWVFKVTSVGCNWLILIHVVDFVWRQGFSQKGVQQSNGCPFLEEIQVIYSLNFL